MYAGKHSLASVTDASWSHASIDRYWAAFLKGFRCPIGLIFFRSYRMAFNLWNFFFFVGRGSESDDEYTKWSLVCDGEDDGLSG